MTVVVTIERRFDRTPDGRVWTPSTGAYGFWQRYLEVFDNVRVLARVREVIEVDPTWERADGPNVSVSPVPYFVGPGQYLLQRANVERAVRDALGPRDAAILRIPGTLATHLEGVLHRQSRAFGVEVVADPYDVFDPASAKHPLSRFFRWWFPRGVRRQCARASAVAYVTAESLQRRYPASAGAFVTSYSSVDIGVEAYIAEARGARHGDEARRILLVGSLDQMYKGADVLIEAVAIAVRRGSDFRLTIVGDGKHRAELESAARACGIAERTRFAGNVPPGDAVRKELDDADLLVMPSRTEGLPRVLVEAMARGLPCVGSDVGGIPELLDRAELVPAGDTEALATKIVEVAGDADRMARLSSRNLEKAREFHRGVLGPRRQAFYEAVCEATSR